MIKIFKYPIAVRNNQTVELPLNSEILCVQAQRNAPFIWAMVDDAKPPGRRLIQTRGTGHDAALVNPDTYIGTYQLDDGSFVGHVFDGGWV